MKKFWFWILISALLGFGTAWAINYQKFGHRVAWFGPFGTASDLKPAELESFLESRLPEGRPRVEMLDEPNFDFGMMAPGSEGEHIFRVKNVGSDDLRLRLGASTCKCTFGDLEREVLAPGEETDIKLSWYVKSGSEEFGQSAEIITNDPRQVVIRFSITGRVIREIDIEPDTWSFGEVATGEPMEVTGTIYNFMETPIEITEVKFTNDEITALSEFDVQPFEPTEENDGIRSVAKQGFHVVARVKPGVRQGAISQNLLLKFLRVDEEGQPIKIEGEEQSDQYVVAPVKGSVVGPLSMILTSKLKGREGGGFLYDFGRIKKGDPLVAKAFVVLKGSERDKTQLSIGQVGPEGVVKAKLGEPKGQGSMKLFPLEIELVPGDEPIERMGRTRDEVGEIWIESDNPKVSKMRIALKFALEPQ